MKNQCSAATVDSRFARYFAIVSAFVAIVSLGTAGLRAQNPTMEFVNAGRGPVALYLPSTYDPAEPLPLVVALHGFTSSGADVEAYFDFVDQIESRRFLYTIPDGHTNFLGQRFWNATDACCDLFNSNVDDSAYLRGLVDLIRSQYAVDDFSIHFVGHSNGGFMSHRMAIDHSDQVASIASLAGANFYDAGAYMPEETVHTLQVHGTADGTIFYNGGEIAGVPYPGAMQTQSNWAMYNGLTLVTQQVGAPFNLDLAVPGDETTRLVFDLNNSAGIAVELWKMTDSAHSPNFGDGSANLFAQHVVDWLLNHRKSSLTLDAIWFDVTRGTLVSGDVPELADSDDQYVVMNPQFLMARYQNVVVVETTSPTDSPSNLEFSLEAKVNNLVGTVDQKIELYNFTNLQYETVDNRTATASDTTVVVTPAGQVNRFVEPGTGTMRARISYQNSLPFWVTRTVNLFLPFQSRVDQISWTLAE